MTPAPEDEQPATAVLTTATALRAHRDAMVERTMALLYAPIANADMPAIVDYRARTCGHERPK